MHGNMHVVKYFLIATWPTAWFKSLIGIHTNTGTTLTMYTLTTTAWATTTFI